MNVLADIEALRAEGRSKTRIILVMAVTMGVLILALIWAFSLRPTTEVLAMTADGRVMPLPTLNEPFHSTERVLSWTAERIEQSYSMSFADMEGYPSKLSFMTPQVRRDFIDAINRAGIVDKVTAERRLLRAVRRESPSLQREGTDGGRYLWSIQMPLQLNFEGATNTDRSTLIVTVVVGRAPLTDYPDGLAIGKIDFVRVGR